MKPSGDPVLRQFPGSQGGFPAYPPGHGWGGANDFKSGWWGGCDGPEQKGGVGVRYIPPHSTGFRGSPEQQKYIAITIAIQNRSLINQPLIKKFQAGIN